MIQEAMRSEPQSPAVPEVPPSRRLLFVDDQEMILRLMQRHFSRRGFEVVIARSVEEAEEALRSSPCDLLVADLGLSPGKPQEGLELVEIACGRHPELRALVLTGIAGGDIEREARARGASRVLTKPQPLAALEGAIRDVLGDGPSKQMEATR